MNIRKLAALLAIVIAALSVVNVKASTPNTIVRSMLIVDFDKGQFYGAMYDSDDHWTPIALTLYDESATTFEDMITTDQDNYITATFELDESGYDNHIAHVYSVEYENTFEYAWRVLDDSDIGTISEVRTYDHMLQGKLNGDVVQFFGYVDNGAAYVLREARPNNCTVACRGYILQHGNVVQYAATNGEDYTYMPVFIPIVTR